MTNLWIFQIRLKAFQSFPRQGKTQMTNFTHEYFTPALDGANRGLKPCTHSIVNRNQTNDTPRPISSRCHDEVPHIATAALLSKPLEFSTILYDLPAYSYICIYGCICISLSVSYALMGSKFTYILVNRTTGSLHPGMHGVQGILTFCSCILKLF